MYAYGLGCYLLSKFFRYVRKCSDFFGLKARHTAFRVGLFISTLGSVSVSGSQSYNMDAMYNMQSCVT